jgi:hypothetical protein
MPSEDGVFSQETMSIAPSPIGFLDLPFELRDMVYSFAIPRTEHIFEFHRTWRQCQYRNEDIRRTDSTGEGRCINYAYPKERSLLYVSRQIYTETRRHYYAGRRICLAENDLTFNCTTNWLARIGRDLLEVMEGMHVTVKTRWLKFSEDSQEWEDTPYECPLEWLKFEEEMLPSSFKLMISDQTGSTEAIWRLTHEIGRRCREHGMSWAVTACCIRPVTAGFEAPLVAARMQDLQELSRGERMSRPMGDLWDEAPGLRSELVNNGMPVGSVGSCIEITCRALRGMSSTTGCAEGNCAEVRYNRVWSWQLW